MIDYKLALEIYTRPWYVSESMCHNFENLLESAKHMTQTTEKLNSFGVITQSSKDKTTEKTYAVYNFDSVITKSGGMSHEGTEQIAAQFQKNDNDPNIKGHLYVIDSGGGSADAVHYMRKYTKKGVRKKTLVAFVKDVMCSAAAYIGSDADYIIASNEFAAIGSLGTMLSFEGYKSGEKDSNGKKRFRVYATKSFNKNAKFENALNNDETQGIIDYLNPFNERFISDMKLNRPNITEEQTSGQDYDAKDCVGTLIDEIGDISLAYAKLDELTKNQTINKMEKTQQELIQDSYEKGLKDGIKKESSRISAWMVWQQVDPEMVQKGIDSGEEIDSKSTQELILKSSQKNRIKELEGSNTEKVVVPETVTPSTESETVKFLKETYKL